MQFFFKVFIWEEKDDAGIATVRELDQRYVLCPKDVLDSFLVEVIRTFRATNKNGSIMIFTDTCKYNNCFLLYIKKKSQKSFKNSNLVIYV